MAFRLFEPQTAALNAVKGIKETMTQRRRPKTSEKGAQMNGPTTKPRM